jgi:hypothetical protein
MTAHPERWSNADIAELARFVLKRHGTGAMAYAQARATMFRASGETDDAGRWAAVAARLQMLQGGNVVPLRPRLVEPAVPPHETERPAVPAGSANGPERAPPAEGGVARLAELLIAAEMALTTVRRNVERQEERIAAEEQAGRDARHALRLLASLHNSLRIRREIADRLRRALVAHGECADAVRRSRLALAESRMLLEASGRRG